MISVCIATYNGAKYIEEQLVSILPQLEANDEIIISDDNSSDNTIEIIMGLKDDRIKIYPHQAKSGTSSFAKATANFENAIIHAKGDYLFLSDQDDIWLPNKVKVSLNALDKALLVTSNFYFYKNNQILNKRFNAENPIRNTLLSNLYHLPFKGCCFAFKKEFLKYILPFPKDILVHDAWIGCVAFMKKSIIYIEEPLILHRIHDHNVSYNKKRSNLFRLRYRFILLQNLYLRNKATHLQNKITQ